MRSDTAEPKVISEADYLAGEAMSEIRHEYVDGQVFAMTGGTVAHAIISGNIFREMSIHLKNKPCHPFTENLKVRVGNDYYYPDVLVDCSELSLDSDFTENPVMIVEVLSDSTRYYDLGKKFESYKTISSLEEYVLVEQKAMDIRIYQRAMQWQPVIYKKGDKVIFASIELKLPMADIYDGITFDDTPIINPFS